MHFFVTLIAFTAIAFAQNWKQSDIENSKKICEKEMTSLSKIEEANIPSSLNINQYCECFVSSHSKEYTPARFNEYYSLMMKFAKSQFKNNQENIILTKDDFTKIEEEMLEAEQKKVSNIGFKCLTINKDAQ